MPTFAGAFHQADVEATKMEWKWRYAHRQNIDNVDIALITEFMKAIPADVIEDVETDIDAARDDTFLQVWKEYGVASRNEIKQNRDGMEASWNPAGGQNFTRVIRQIRDGQCFAVYTNNAYFDKQLVQMGKKIFLDTHNFKGDYGKWMKRPEHKRTWTNFIGHVGTAYEVWKITGNASGNFGYGGGANDTGKDESREQLDGINAATNAANAATFQQLSSTNANLTAQNTQLNAQLALLQQQFNSSNRPTPQHQTPRTLLLIKIHPHNTNHHTNSQLSHLSHHHTHTCPLNHKMRTTNKATQDMQRPTADTTETVGEEAVAVAVVAATHEGVDLEATTAAAPPGTKVDTNPRVGDISCKVATSSSLPTTRQHLASTVEDSVAAVRPIQ
eukprot:CCRYP_020025-RA/>CCRYP_020025-RA protein AED:0.99 eAED:0.41 QI:0/-1/0/1/-1/1/1/0/386